jgi:hypothetical protein
MAATRAPKCALVEDGVRERRNDIVLIAAEFEDEACGPDEMTGEASARSATPADEQRLNRSVRAHKRGEIGVVPAGEQRLSMQGTNRLRPIKTLGLQRRPPPTENSAFKTIISVLMKASCGISTRPNWRKVQAG